MMKTTSHTLASAPIASGRIAAFVPCRQTASFSTWVRHSVNKIHDVSLSNGSLNHQVQGLTTGTHQPLQAASHTAKVSRRGAVLALVSGALALRSRSALAEEEPKLPKEYRQLVLRLSEGLGESIVAEASGASEAEVRRKADPAKDTVREFVRKWRDNPRVSSDLTHAELKEALAELGEFYLAYGQRTKLTPPVRESVLRHLSAAKAALPEEAEKKGSSLLNLF